MILNEQIVLDGAISSVAVSPSGELAAVAVDQKKVQLFDLSRGTLAPRATHALPTSRYEAPWVKNVLFNDTRLAFLDEHTIVVRWWVERESSDRSIPFEDRRRSTLLAVDAESGEVRGAYETFETGGGLDPLPVSSRHVLVSIHTKTLACVDIETWREVCRVRELDEAYDPIADEAECPEEGLTPNGVAFVPEAGLLHVLWGFPYGSALQTYRLADDCSGFASIRRRAPFEREPYALCARPDGSEFGVLLSDEGTQLELPGATHRLPPTSRLGDLALVGREESRFISVECDTERDLACWKNLYQRPDAPIIVKGYTLFVERPYDPKLFFIDEGRVVLPSPKGYLICVDTERGRSELVHDFLYPVTGMAFHRQTRRLLTGCRDKSLTLITV